MDNVYREKLNSLGISRRINNSALGKAVGELNSELRCAVEELSEHPIYPRLSDLIQLPFSGVGFILCSTSGFVSDRASIGLALGSLASYGVGELITYPLRKVENAFLGKRDNIGNIFERELYPISNFEFA